MVDMITEFYEVGLWNIERMYNVVGKALTEEQYKEITGFEYPNKK